MLFVLVTTAFPTELLTFFDEEWTIVVEMPQEDDGQKENNKKKSKDKRSKVLKKKQVPPYLSLGSFSLARIQNLEEKRRNWEIPFIAIPCPPPEALS